MNMRIRTLLIASVLALTPFAVQAGKERILGVSPQSGSGFQVRPGGGAGFAVPGDRTRVAQRRVPGSPPPGAPEDLPPIDPDAVPPPAPNLPREFIPIPDRWRLIEAVGVNEKWWDPYNQNTLKGDRPVYKDWFVNLLVISDTVFEPRSFPTPIAPQTSEEAGDLDVFGDNDQILFNENLIVSLSIIKGNTAYKPPDYEFRFTPIFNYNRVEAEENRVLLIDPDRGRTRTDRQLAWQELFVDYHIHNVSDRYDFDSIRGGIQPFSSDFRGFLFQDSQLGVRLFGSRDNNIFQYNLAWFRRLEKDTNSGLNDITTSVRDDDIYVANLYWQDFLKLGFVSQVTVLHNRNREDNATFFNLNGFLERPAPIGEERLRNYDVTYIGYNGDGRLGRFNLTASAYYAFGEDSRNNFASLDDSDIRAWFFAAEPSVDFSWIRLRGSFLYASGDDDPFDDREEGFDAPFENPQFAGADTSYWIRQTIPLVGGGGLALSQRNAVLPSLKSSKEHGQSNFNNPGLWLVGVGTDLDLTPELRLSTNFNYLRFDNTSNLEFLRNQGDIDESIGYDLSAALIWRPLFIQNIVLRLSGAVLIPETGFDDLFKAEDDSEDIFYSVLANLVLTY